ncbi:SH3 domain-containing protein [Anaerosinus massiliensis]|uniref:SH3 domain-containing protein n=1 Tax=Massilibacillus massiliensis TaxID=1806837 RepID=UPI000DA6102D|nr:SH3 domain-containing protein [Massilibacillus massiliensis]
MDENTRQASESTTSASATGISGRPIDPSQTMFCGCPQPMQEVIEVEQVLAAEMRQKILEFDMCVPKRKPDIRQVVDVYVKDVDIYGVEVIPNRVVVRGDLEVKVMYVADLPNEPVHAFEKSHIKFLRDIEVEGAHPDMTATADCSVEYVDYDFDECQPRKVHITIVLKFWTRVTTMAEMEVTTMSPIEPGTMYGTSGFADNKTSASEFSDEQISFMQSTYGVPPIPEPIIPEEVIVTETVEPTAGTNMSVNGRTGTLTGNSVNVRTGPGTDYPSITKVNKGTVVTVREQAFGWYKVVLSDGTTGWLASWFVSLND